MNTRQNTNTKLTVSTAFFAAVIFLGIQSFRIPLPAAVGTPFLHFGHIFVMLAIVCLGGKRATISALTGLITFDILNGYIHAIPNIFVSTIIKCLFIGYIFSILVKNAGNNPRKEMRYAVVCAVIYGATNIFIDFVWNTIELVILGSDLNAAILAEITSIPATMINAVFTVIGTALLYIPVTTYFRKIIKI